MVPSRPPLSYANIARGRGASPPHPPLMTVAFVDSAKPSSTRQCRFNVPPPHRGKAATRAHRPDDLASFGHQILRAISGFPDRQGPLSRPRHCTAPQLFQFSLFGKGIQPQYAETCTSRALFLRQTRGFFVWSLQSCEFPRFLQLPATRGVCWLLLKR